MNQIKAFKQRVRDGKLRENERALYKPNGWVIQLLKVDNEWKRGCHVNMRIESTVGKCLVGDGMPDIAQRQLNYEHRIK